ncbi:MAG TPA: HPr-rel-A system PqqD family peptide chaperone [Pseudomonadota bacterium]|jgi:PqqD family protein of HPr-rel-A system|nr:HPr-rel-A system PqqD family peptide chaperone [Pseudomonadota bacterium]
MSTAHLKDLALSDTGFVFDPYTGATFTTNASGLAILHALKEGRNRKEILSQLRDRFDVHGDLETDLTEFIQLLRQHGVVAGDFAVPDK